MSYREDRHYHHYKHHRRADDSYDERKIMDGIPKIPYLSFGEIIGHGHFSHVYNGTYHSDTPVAIKVIERGSESLIETEVDLLRKLRNCPQIVQLLEVIQDQNAILIFERLPSVEPDYFYTHVTIQRLRFTIESILKAISFAHSRGIVHRDVKLGNILIAPHFESVKLIDWGCGTWISSSMSPKAGSRTCRSPEMLLGYRNYGTGCDTWAVGVFILSVLSDGRVPWRADTSGEALIKLSRYFGGNNIIKYADDLGAEISDEIEEGMGDYPSCGLSESYSPEFSDLFDDDLSDLMHKLLTLDYRDRISAEDALRHPFFARHQ